MEQYIEIDDLSQDAILTKLYQRYARTILMYIRPQVATLEDAEDILVEVFLAAVQQPLVATLSEKEQWYWLRRVAHNKIIDAFRHNQRYKILPLKEASDYFYDERCSPEQIALDQEQLIQVCLHINTLSKPQQQVLTLRFTYNLPIKEIAARIGKSETNVRVLLSRALKQLRKVITNDLH